MKTFIVVEVTEENELSAVINSIEELKKKFNCIEVNKVEEKQKARRIPRSGIDYNELFKSDWEKKLQQNLFELGITPALSGYIYLTLAVKYMKNTEEPYYMLSLFNDIYPAVQCSLKEYYPNKEKTLAEIERTTRYLIQTIWKNNSPERIKEVLGFSSDKKMTIKDFLFSIIETI